MALLGRTSSVLQHTYLCSNCNCKLVSGILSRLSRFDKFFHNFLMVELSFFLIVPVLIECKARTINASPSIPRVGLVFRPYEKSHGLNTSTVLKKLIQNVTILGIKISLIPYAQCSNGLYLYNIGTRLMNRYC